MQVQQHEPSTEESSGTAIERTSDAAVEPAETRSRMVTVAPPVDIFENEEELLLLTDLPGVARDAIELNLDGGALSIVAMQPDRGRAYRRAFTLPEAIDPSAVEAELKDGVLTVHLRKREDMKPRRVEIRSPG